MEWLFAVPSLLGLGLVMGFSPTLYGYTLHQLTRSRPASVRSMVIGLVAASTLLVVVFQFFDPTNLTKLLRHRIDALLLARGVDIAAGICLVAAGTVMLILRRDDRAGSPRDPARLRVPRNAAAMRYPRVRAALVGFGNTLIGFSGVATMYLVGRVASQVSDRLLLRALAYCVFLVTLVAPYLLVTWAWDRYPGFARRVRGGYAWVVDRDFKGPIAVGLLIVGAALLGLGLLGWQS